MSRRVRVVAAVTLAVVLVAVAAVVGVRLWRATQETALQRAVALAPADAQRWSWTDWAAVRREAGAEVGASASTEDVEEMLSAAFDADLTSTSALVESTALLQEEFGWSPASVEWELLAQATDGAAIVVGLAEDTSGDALGDRLRRLGYTPPDDADGVWDGGPEVLAAAAASRTSTPLLQYIAVDAEEGVLTASDNRRYLEGLLADRADDDADPGEHVDRVVDAVAESVSAVVFRGEQACRELAMGQADPDDQAEAERLVDEAGEVNPLAAFAIGARPDRDVVVAMAFESDEQARRNADTRATLAAGPAPGQGGAFPDRFRLGDVTADGQLLTMQLEPVDGAYVLSDLSSGPVLFATC